MAGTPSSGVSDNEQTFCETLSTEGRTQSFKRKKAQAVMLGLSISVGMAGVAGERDSLVEDQNTYPQKRRKPSRKTRLSDKWRSGRDSNPRPPA